MSGRELGGEDGPFEDAAFVVVEGGGVGDAFAGGGAGDEDGEFEFEGEGLFDEDGASGEFGGEEGRGVAEWRRGGGFLGG